MNSLEELNNYASTDFEFDDGRDSGVIFDRTTPTNQFVTTTEAASHSVPVGLEIEQIINYSSAAVTYTIGCGSGPVGTTVSWDTVPDGCTVTYLGNRTWRISGAINTPAIWDIIKSPTVTLPSGYNNNYFQYNAVVGYNGTESEYWLVGVSVGTVNFFSTPSATTYTSGDTTSITGEPQINFTDLGTFTVTVTPSLTGAVTTLSSAGSGGTSTFNSTTKVLTITGTKTQVNSHLSAISVTSTSGNHWTYTLDYYGTVNGYIATGTASQELSSTDETILSDATSDQSYTLNTVFDSSNNPLITDNSNDGWGTYTTTFYAIPSNAIFNVDFDTNIEMEVFNQNQRQTISSSETSADFGHSVSVSGDGLYIAIGDRLDDGTYTDQGLVRIYKRASATATTWTLQASLTASDAQADDSFGYDVALNNDGSYLIVGAPYDNNSIGTDAGSVYIYTRSGTSWSEQTRLQAGTGSTNALFGYSVSINNDGDTVAVGSPYEDTWTTDAGAVYIFQRSGTSWSEKKKINGLNSTITPSAMVPGSLDQFGKDVQLSGNGLVLVALSPTTNSTSNLGALHVFRNSSGAFDWNTFDWVGSSRGQNGGSDVGIESSVTISNDAAYVAGGSVSNESVFVFTTDLVYPYSISQQTQLTIAGNTDFGKSLFLSDDGSSLVIGAEIGVTDGYQSGCVHYYTRSSTTWTSKQIIGASDANANLDYFGRSISMDRNAKVISIGAPDEDTGASNSGSVYIFDKLLTSYDAEWDEPSRTLTINDSKWATNGLLSHMNITPGLGYKNDFDMITSTTTPDDDAASRNQKAIKS